MKQVELREINKIVSQYRKHLRAKERLQGEAALFVAFHGGYGRHTEIPIADADRFRTLVQQMIDGELSRLRKRLAEFGIDPVETKKGKKLRAKVEA